VSTIYSRWSQCSCVTSNVPGIASCTVAGIGTGVYENRCQYNVTFQTSYTGDAVQYGEAGVGSYTPTATQGTANTYTISFDANGGVGGQSADMTATYGVAMPSISTVAPTRVGYTFMGWYDNVSYTAGTQYYTAVGQSARNWDKTSATTLYAGCTELGYDFFGFNRKGRHDYDRTKRGTQS